MKHPHDALTQDAVEDLLNAPVAAHVRRFADGGGLYLVLNPNGGKSWVLRVVVRGKRRELGLGSAALVSLDEARRAGKQLRKVARTGGEPKPLVTIEDRGILLTAFDRIADPFVRRSIVQVACACAGMRGPFNE